MYSRSSLFEPSSPVLLMRIWLNVAAAQKHMSSLLLKFNADVHPAMQSPYEVTFLLLVCADCSPTSCSGLNRPPPPEVRVSILQVQNASTNLIVRRQFTSPLRCTRRVQQHYSVEATTALQKLFSLNMTSPGRMAEVRKSKEGGVTWFGKLTRVPEGNSWSDEGHCGCAKGTSLYD
jgi:hypothetical protein